MDKNIFFSSDWHLNHKNIIKYCNRPFSNIEEMRKKIIENHNSLVSNDDMVYHLGDFIFAPKSGIVDKIYSTLSKLNGRHILILGNHDDSSPKTYLKGGFESVHTSLILPNDNRFILNHDPAVSELNKEVTWIVGHVHTLFITQRNCINVGIDVWNYYPVSFKKIKEYLKIGKGE